MPAAVQGIVDALSLMSMEGRYLVEGRMPVAISTLHPRERHVVLLCEYTGR